jgi:hypothetical protein
MEQFIKNHINAVIVLAFMFGFLFGGIVMLALQVSKGIK